MDSDSVCGSWGQFFLVLYCFLSGHSPKASHISLPARPLSSIPSCYHSAGSQILVNMIPWVWLLCRLSHLQAALTAAHCLFSENIPRLSSSHLHGPQFYSSGSKGPKKIIWSNLSQKRQPRWDSLAPRQLLCLQSSSQHLQWEQTGPQRATLLHMDASLTVSLSLNSMQAVSAQNSRLLSP